MRHAILHKIDQNILIGDEQLRLAETLTKGALAATYAHLHDVSEQRRKTTGQPLPVSAEGIRDAYIVLDKKLRNKQYASRLTDEQLTSELMAKAILFAPQVSDALKTHHHDDSKRVLAQYNDIVGEIARSLPTHMQLGYKTAVVHALMKGSRDLNDKIGHSSEISGKDPASGIDIIWSVMKGVQDEIASETAIENDPTLRLIVPEDIDSDLRGIDMMVESIANGKIINIDTKSHGKYLSTVAIKEHVDWVDEQAIGPYYYVGMHENGHQHFLLNASAFGELPDNSLTYTPEGQAKLIRVVHEMLEYK